MHSTGMMLNNTSKLPGIDTAISIIICNKLLLANTHDCLAVILHIIKTELPLKFQCSPLKLLLFLQIIKILPFCHLAAAISLSLSLIRETVYRPQNSVKTICQVTRKHD